MTALDKILNRLNQMTDEEIVKATGYQSVIPYSICHSCKHLTVEYEYGEYGGMEYSYWDCPIRQDLVDARPETFPENIRRCRNYESIMSDNLKKERG